MPFARARFPLLAGLLFLATLWLAPAGQAQQVDSGYGPLPVFEFHSSFWVNLHQFLYHEARLREAASESHDSAVAPKAPVLRQTPVSLTPEEQKTWEAAIAYYRANYSGKDPQVNFDMILLKNQLGDFEDCTELLGARKKQCDAGLPGKVGAILESAAPIYRTHWWPDQDRANRRWVARIAPLIREQGVGVSQRLADIYQTPWPKEKIRVDVCAYANSAGAFTTLDPLRVTISSTEARNQDAEALAVLFHEASHGIALPVEVAITRECRQRDKPIPRDLWHALIFYTTDEVLRPVMDSPPTVTTENEPILPKTKTAAMPPDLREKLTQRGWEDYIRLLNSYWQPYLAGKVTFEDAIAHLISAA